MADLTTHNWADYWKNKAAWAKYKLTNDRTNLIFLQLKQLSRKILRYYEKNPELATPYKAELAYLKEHPIDITFPYRRLKRWGQVAVNFDRERQLSFVVYDGKRLYFPAKCSTKEIETIFLNLIENDNILGGDYRAKSPHQYQTEQFHVEKSDTLVDVGCAEGLFALAMIDQVKKVYLIEGDPEWTEALKATFAPYEDKITLITKWIADKDSETTTTLTSILKDEPLHSLFIKMDIEGYETQVVESSEDLLRKATNIRVVACTYHKKKDAEILEKLFDSMNYQTEFSDGYMIFALDQLQPPYFRKGLIRAYK
ncbi:MAG: methyltransferase [Dysgonamonadaceae bacterium]|jgi:hypothetical protein|nr:methyltransferase [Dysgonamonadaceae bacterium]